MKKKVIIAPALGEIPRMINHSQNHAFNDARHAWIELFLKNHRAFLKKGTPKTFNGDQCDKHVGMSS